MSRQLAPYRSYCLCCCNYSILRRYVTGQYFCHSCTCKITRALLRLDIDPRIHFPDLAAIRLSLEQVVSAIQQEMDKSEHVTRWEHNASTKRWRHAPRRH